MDIVVRDKGWFLGGVADGDGHLDPSDALRIISCLFRIRPLSCPDAADADGSEALDLTDLLRMLDRLFHFRPAPPAPFSEPGEDPAGSALGREGP